MPPGVYVTVGSYIIMDRRLTRVHLDIDGQNAGIDIDTTLAPSMHPYILNPST